MNQAHETRHCAQEIGQTRDKLMRFAMRRLRNRAQAEDAVQETLIAAIEGIGGFAADSPPPSPSRRGKSLTIPPPPCRRRMQNRR